MNADVIIAGAGPAGSMAAYCLASAGISVIILEKQQFPRYKVCGAGLTHKILKEIPFDIEPVIETTVRNFIFSRGFQDVFQRTGDSPLIYCTMRDKLDALLLDRASAAGATVMHGRQVVKIREEVSGVIVQTKEAAFRSKLLIGAEGASGIVARSAKLWQNMMPGLAWEAELKVDALALEKYNQHVFLDWGSFPGGYGWMFPKKDHFSVGVGGPATLSRHMMDYYGQFLNYMLSMNIRVEETLSMRSWPIPVRVKPGRVNTERIMVTGDAAGFTDPLTGEGIYYAIRSGLLAGEAALSYLNSGKNLESYSKSVNAELMPELLEANRIKYLFNTAPVKIHHFVRDNDRAWSAFGKVLRGERNYADVRKGFGKWKPLWNAACAGAKKISDYRENRFRREGF